MGYRRLAFETAMCSANLCAFPVVQCWHLKHQIGSDRWFSASSDVPADRFELFENLPVRAQG